MNYKVEVREVLSRIIEIEANNEEAAIEMIHNQYTNEELVLDSSDFYSSDIKIFE